MRGSEIGATERSEEPQARGPVVARAKNGQEELREVRDRVRQLHRPILEQLGEGRADDSATKGCARRVVDEVLVGQLGGSSAMEVEEGGQSVLAHKDGRSR